MPVLEASRTQQLTLQEWEIIILIGRGYPDWQISERLALDTESLQQQIDGIRGKLGLTSRLDLALYGATRAP